MKVKLFKYMLRFFENKNGPYFLDDPVQNYSKLLPEWSLTDTEAFPITFNKAQNNFEASDFYLQSRGAKGFKQHLYFIHAIFVSSLSVSVKK